MDREMLIRRIIKSGDFTALEKRFLEHLVRQSVDGVWLRDRLGFYRCSLCGYEFYYPDWTEPQCPGCGANMEVRVQK